MFMLYTPASHMKWLQEASDNTTTENKCHSASGELAPPPGKRPVRIAANINTDHIKRGSCRQVAKAVLQMDACCKQPGGQAKPQLHSMHSQLIPRLFAGGLRGVVGRGHAGSNHDHRGGLRRDATWVPIHRLLALDLAAC